MINGAVGSSPRVCQVIWEVCLGMGKLWHRNTVIIHRRYFIATLVIVAPVGLLGVSCAFLELVEGLTGACNPRTTREAGVSTISVLFICTQR